MVFVEARRGTVGLGGPAGVLPPRIISLRRRCKVVSKLIQWRLIEDKHKFFEEVEKRLRIGARCKGVPGVKVEAKIEVDASRRVPKNAGHREGPAYNAIRVDALTVGDKGRANLTVAKRRLLRITTTRVTVILFPRSSNFKVEERLEASIPL
ncbi:hypothetical protein V1477_001155 [Vespula maculifrons]|uniref:Uncharacterized protein n=1 Tax=Vespula maculifrons TaxID=7453 RepID=A0ABD2CZP4_VESMC